MEIKEAVSVLKTFANQNRAATKMAEILALYSTSTAEAGSLRQEKQSLKKDIEQLSQTRDGETMKIVNLKEQYKNKEKDLLRQYNLKKEGVDGELAELEIFEDHARVGLKKENKELKAKNSKLASEIQEKEVRLEKINKEILSLAGQ